MHRPLLLAVAILLIAGCSVPRWPVDGTFTSPFGVRSDGMNLYLHQGVDISVPVGTPIRAMAPGVVEFAGVLGGYGNVIIIDHGSHTRTVYAHLSEIHVRQGQEVHGRPVIGLSGATGRVTGPHLHFEIQRHGRAEDPVPLLGGFPRRR